MPVNALGFDLARAFFDRKRGFRSALTTRLSIPGRIVARAGAASGEAPILTRARNRHPSSLGDGFPYYVTMAGAVAVLINRESYSAAKELAGRLQDNRAATPAGKKTGGAGCG